jgi:peptidyl-prolyl cis-trans isomerase SurA
MRNPKGSLKPRTWAEISGSIRTLLLSFLLLFLPFGYLFGQDSIERIVAVVGDEPILSSELAAQIQLMAIQGGVRPKNETELRQMQEEVLNELIAERLLLIEARKDTAINVSDEQVEQAIDEHISGLISQFPSDEVFLEELAKEGMTLRSFRKKLQPEMKNRLLKQQLINQKLASISISNQAVEEFFNKYRDSIPDQPAAARIAHILITFQPSGGTEDSVRTLAEQVRKNAVSGADFSTLAMTNSSGPSAIAGGDLGFISKDDVVPEFGRAAFNLLPGEISGVVRTEYGYHIIRCIERRGEQSHLQQILFEVAPTPADSMLSYKLADSLQAELEAGADFRELAKIFSADDDTRKQGGELGWFALDDLPPSFREGVAELDSIGATFGPVQSEYGLHILKLLDRQEARVISLETDFDKIKEMARHHKTGEKVDEWLDQIKEKVYVEIRPL